MPGAFRFRPLPWTGIIDRLEKRGLVTRTRSTGDKRKVEIALTEAGRALGAQMPPPLHEVFSRRLNALPVGEQERIDRVLATIVTMMEAPELAAAPLPLEAALSPFLDSSVPFAPSPAEVEADRTE